MLQAPGKPKRCRRPADGTLPPHSTMENVGHGGPRYGLRREGRPADRHAALASAGGGRGSAFASRPARRSLAAAYSMVSCTLLSMIPVAMACRVRAAVLWRSSFFMRLARCFSTVLMLMSSPSAICLLASPSAIR